MGEDVKNIDWVIVSAKLETLCKSFSSQKLNIKLSLFSLVLTYFGTDKFKQDIIVELVNALDYISIKQGNPFSSFIANDSLQICTKKIKTDF